MNKIFTKGRLSLFIIISFLLIDQAIKIAVKTQMYWHQHINAIEWIYDKLGITATPPTWFYIFFTENNGMAFGLEIFDKLFLTLFRIVAVAGIGWLLHKFIKQDLKTGFIVCVSLILTGALGNIIDCVFYGVIFDESSYSSLATFLPEAGGYSSWFHGRVVDMFYFPIIETTWPAWVPFVGGNPFIFFSPIFNFADVAISCGVIALFLFYGKEFNDAFHSVFEK